MFLYRIKKQELVEKGYAPQLLIVTNFSPPSKGYLRETGISQDMNPYMLVRSYTVANGSDDQLKQVGLKDSV